MANLKRIIVSGGGGSGGYQTIQEDGSPLAQETTLNFIGDAVTITDNPGVSTNITFAGNLNDIAALTPAANSVITGNGTHFVDTVITPGETLYVAASTGNDTTGNGSILFPYATIGKAVAESSVGTTIDIEGGTYTETISFSNVTQISLVGGGNTDYSSVFISGSVSFDSTSDHITFIGIAFSNSSAAMVDVVAAAHISFQSCVFNAGAATNPAINISGAITGEIDLRDCLIDGTVANSATAFYQLYILGQQSTNCNVVASNGATVILNCPNLGKVTHSGGIIELNNIAYVQATSGTSITSTANSGATAQFILNNTNVQQSDLTYGAIAKTGTCIYIITNCNYAPTTTFSGTRQNFGALATDLNANYTPTNYTAVNGSVEGNLNGIDNALSSINPKQYTVETANTALVKNQGYVANSSSNIVFTLPVTAALGDQFEISSVGTGTFTIAQNSGQSIRFGADITTTGTGGSIASTDIGDSITVLCWSANTQFIVINGAIGNFNVT